MFLAYLLINAIKQWVLVAKIASLSVSRPK